MTTKRKYIYLWKIILLRNCTIFLTVYETIRFIIYDETYTHLIIPSRYTFCRIVNNIFNFSNFPLHFHSHSYNETTLSQLIRKRGNKIWLVSGLRLMLHRRKTCNLRANNAEAFQKKKKKKTRSVFRAKARPECSVKLSTGEQQLPGTKTIFILIPLDLCAAKLSRIRGVHNSAMLQLNGSYFCVYNRFCNILTRSSAQIVMIGLKLRSWGTISALFI